MITSPVPFDLQIPDDFFVVEGRGLPAHPDIADCHTQGMAIAGETLVLSCVLYDPADPDRRTLQGKSYILAARLCEVVGCNGPPAQHITWHAQDITGEAPAAESDRITRMRLHEEALTGEERTIRHLTSHPSGMVYDASRKGVWVANAVYAPDSYTDVLLIDPDRLGQTDSTLVQRAIPVRAHVGALALVQDRYLVGFTWASRRIVVMDLASDATPVSVANPFLGTAEHVEIQDADTWDANTILAGGLYAYEARPESPDVPLSAVEAARADRDTVRVRRGRLQLLHIDTSSFPLVPVRLEGDVMAALGRPQTPLEDVGIRLSREEESGATIDLIINDYGGYRSVRPLTSEGMAISPDRQHVYFAPDDLPAGKLLRLRILRALPALDALADVPAGA